MTIKPGLAAVAAVSSAVLIFSNTAHAEGPSLVGYAPSYETVEHKPAPDAPILPPVEISSPIPPRPLPIAPSPQFEKLADIEQIATQIEAPAASRPAVANAGGNSYVWGQCTWYAKSKRPDLPNNLGNGGSWVANAAAYGYSTGSVPKAGAIGEEPGHVVYIESVNDDGTVNISEMNYNGGVGVVHTRTVAASNYTYIY